ncbi:MAG: aspartyl protease family protein [Acidobacteria bacterium]|nr:aspartyl protease family protein [Acidobacteriota bacterium]
MIRFLLFRIPVGLPALCRCIIHAVGSNMNNGMVADLRIVRLFALAAVFCLCSVAQEGPSCPDDYVDGTSKPSETPIAFDYYRRSIILPACLGREGIKSATEVVIDTGTNRTIVDLGLARLLGLAPVGKGHIVDSTGARQESLTVKLELVRIGRHEVRNLEASVQDLKLLSRDTRRSIGAILGTDFLSGSLFRIDFMERRIVVSKKRVRDKRLVEIARIPLKTVRGLPIAECTLRNGRQFPLIVDTGHIFNVLLDEQESNEIPLVGPITSRTLGSQLGSVEEVRVGQLAWFKCGTLQTEAIQVEVRPTSAKHSPRMEFSKGLLGNGLLERYICEFDLTGRLLRLLRRRCD